MANGEIQGHVEFDNHNYQVVDLLDADLSSVTEEETEFPAVTDLVPRWKYNVFSTREDALKWARS
jgi:hypothetical protein